jgi:hypothetical protein
MAARKTPPVRKTTRAATTRRPSLTVRAAVQNDLDDLAKRAPDLATSALAASALALAREIDKPKNSATSKSMCAKALLDVLETLRDLAPPEEEADQLDDLSSRRAARLAAGSAAT